MTGWTPTDPILPYFLFIVGVAISYTLPAIATSLLGIFTGEWLQSERSGALAPPGRSGFYLCDSNP